MLGAGACLETFAGNGNIDHRARNWIEGPQRVFDRWLVGVEME